MNYKMLGYNYVCTLNLLVATVSSHILIWHFLLIMTHIITF